MESIKRTIALSLLGLAFVGFMLGYAYVNFRDTAPIQLLEYQLDPEGADLPWAEGLQRCAEAPFVMPTEGWVGILFGDSILGVRDHSGLDIFGPEGNGVTPVYAAYDGYLTRYENWVSAVIIRHPRDPFNTDRQIWTYYAHMADAQGNSYIIDEIPAGTTELFVAQGTLLGYQGDYNGGNLLRPISTHLHFSIVLDDGFGRFLNETDRTNTLDPSPYLGMRLATACADRPPLCRPDWACE